MIEQTIMGTLHFLMGISEPEFLVGLAALCAASLAMGLGIGKITNRIRESLS